MILQQKKINTFPGYYFLFLFIIITDILDTRRKLSLYIMIFCIDNRKQPN